MSLQGLTVAISTSGLQYFFHNTLQPSIVSALQKMAVPAPSINLGTLYFGLKPSPRVEAYPPVEQSPTYWAVNTNVSLSNGSLTNFSPVFQEFTQGNNGEFTVKLSAQNIIVDYKWNESYDEQKCPWLKRPGDKGCTDQGQKNHVFDYKMGIGTWDVVIVFKFQYSANTWQLSLVSSTSTAANLSANLPPDSVVYRTQADCFGNAAETNTKQALENIDFSAALKTALQPLFGSIPQSGQIAPDITFDFPIGPSGITYPNNSGLVTGVTGTASWKGTVYPGTNPPQLEVPPVPSDHHLKYFVSDYSINALFWAFFSAGLLTTTATQANTGGNSSVLTTKTFKGSPAHAIYDKYPNVPMTANITALSAPTVALTSVYEPTEAVLNAIQPPLPSAILAKLQDITANIYVSDSAFFTDLVNYLGQADADQYKTILERSVQEVAAVVTHSNKVIMNVLVQGNPVCVLTLDISETDTLEQFVLGHNEAKTTQTLQFVPSVIPGLTNATCVSSPLRGIDVQSFGYIYNLALQPVFAKVATAVGKAGVALPRIKGFNFLFDRATIDLEPGYASVLTDVMHTNDNGVLYFQSKRRIQPGEPMVWPATPRKNRSALPPKRPLPPVPAEWPSLNQSE
jgi:hypothetical protein